MATGERHFGQIKALYPTFGFILTDAGLELFFLPTAVNADVCRFKHLPKDGRVTVEIEDHPRGLRARYVELLPHATTTR